MSLIKKYKARLQEISTSPKKFLGQNFLINEGAIQRILENIKVEKNTRLIEIGPGLGAITDELLDKDFKPILIELDRDFARYWRGRGQNVIEKDALKLDWSELLLGHNSTLVSNLPYQISASLVLELSTLNHTFEDMVLMFQKEVAQRITAKKRTKNYGILSVIAQSHWQIKKIMDLSPRSFYPSPKVFSRILSFKKKESDLNSKQFLTFVKKCFSQRRKMLTHNLLSYDRISCKQDVHKALETVQLDLKCRAEELSVNELALLFKEIVK